MSFKFLIIFPLFLLSSFAYGAAVPSGESSRNSELKKWSVTLNGGELVGFGIGSAILDIGYLPLHFDVNYLLNENWQLNFGLVFRYDWGSFIGPEFIGMAGMRYSLSGTGLRGSFVSLKTGPGYVTGSMNPPPGSYSTFEWATQPEIGYSFQLGSSGYLTLGAGMLYIVATPQPGGWTTLGYLIHVFVPIVDVGIGFTF